jgi:hypothetical protein
MQPDRILLERDLAELISKQTQELIQQVISDHLDNMLQEGLESGLNIRSIYVEKEAAETINAHRLVACDQSGKIITANWERPNAIGLVTQSVTAGETVKVLVFGVVRHDGWRFDLTRPIVLNNAGQPVQSDVSFFPVLTRVGRPLSVDSFLAAIESPIRFQ